LKELIAMAEGRAKLQWAQTSLLAALLFNPHRRPGTPAKEPREFDPTAERTTRGVDFDALKRAFKGTARQEGQ
jgi:hypothetical protein